MFNSSLKKEAIRIHDEALERYNKAYGRMTAACEELYEVRTTAVDTIRMIEQVINSIANTPKEFNTKLGNIGRQLKMFRETEEYAEEAYDASVKAGVNIVAGAATGLGIASMAPTVLMSIATTFGTASTGTAISALSGAAAQKAAVAWIGRTFAGFAVNGAGMAAGNAFLALAGPVGWGITAASTGVSLISLTNRNKKISAEAVKEAKEIAKAREALDETSENIDALSEKTTVLENDISADREKIIGFMNQDFIEMSNQDKLYLGTLLNNTQSLSTLLNETIE